MPRIGVSSCWVCICYASLDFVREDKDMNTSKKPSIIATVTSAIAVAVFTASAHAELLVGMSFSYGHKELESTYYDMSEAVVALESIQTDNNGNVDVFGQWRSDGKSLFGAYPGVHFGVGQSTGEYFERIDFPDRTGGRVDSEIKQGNTFDLLGVMVWDGVTVWDDDKVKDKVEFIVRPYIMLGFTAVELDITATVEGGGFGNPDALNKGRMMDEENIILTGYKAVAGVELGNLNWIFHAAIQYVNYGSKETFLISDIVSDVANSRTRNFFNRSRYGLIEKFGIRLGVSYIF